MGGRELRAVLLFVLVSLAAGAAIRAWRWDGGPTLVERVRGAAEEARLDAERAGGLPPAAPFGAPADAGALRHPGAPSEGAARSRASRQAPPPLGLLDPDRATAADWERLPGIGPSLAARIVADRAARGPFGGAEGLARVRGIGPKTVARLRPYLRRDPADSLSPNAN
jgi:competence protein ComEA